LSALTRIVVVTYNAAGGFVDAAIESALAQTAACEVVIVDNASSDGSIERLRARFANVTIVVRAENSGFAHAVNAGVALETGRRPEFVALLNPDAHALPDWIETMTAWMGDRSIDLASSVVSAGASTFFAGGSWRPYLGLAQTHFSFAGERAQWVSGCAMIVRTELFERIGGFDERYFLYSEDVDFSMRAAAAGAHLGVHEKSLVDHPDPGKSTNALGALQKRRIAMTSRGRLLRRFSRGVSMPSAVLFQTLVSPALNGASLREYPVLARAFLEGFRDAGPVRAGL
jgi:N-acetylglucosaminyl-diphospho-decaprenol L-rhamnosyltransferase